MGKIPICTNIFEMGWNHQLDKQFIHSKEPLGISPIFSRFWMDHPRPLSDRSIQVPGPPQIGKMDKIEEFVPYDTQLYSTIR